MKPRLLISATILLLAHHAVSQDVYYDSIWNVTSRENAFYYRIIDTIPGNFFMVNDYYLDGTLQMKGVYSSLKKETKNGLFSWYSPEGVKTEESYYENGRMNGSHKIWYENGQQKLIGKMTYGEKDSTWIWWYENGELWTIADYKDGKVNGRWITFYENGVKKEFYIAKDNKFAGIGEGWDSTGIKQFDINLDPELKNGDFKLFYPDGILMGQGQIKDGRPNGEWIAYYSNGNKKGVGTALNGYKFGKWIYYNDDGTIEGIIIYDNKNKEKLENMTRELKKFLNLED